MTHATDHRDAATCSLAPADQAARSERWGRLAERSLVSRHATSTGVRLTFDGREEVESELAELAAAERECCGFAEWRVRRIEDGSVVLEVTTASALAPSVHAMFGAEL